MAIAFIFDCGATNLRTIAIDDTGKILSAHHLPNNTQPGVENPDYHIWAIDEIWGKLLTCAKQTLAELSPEQRQQIVGISVTTFGVDGALFDKQGNPTLSDYFVEMSTYLANYDKPRKLH